MFFNIIGKIKAGWRNRNINMTRTISFGVFSERVLNLKRTSAAAAFNLKKKKYKLKIINKTGSSVKPYEILRFWYFYIF